MAVGAIIVLVVLIRTECRNKTLPCFPSKEQRMARQLRENQASNGQVRKKLIPQVFCNFLLRPGTVRNIFFF